MLKLHLYKLFCVLEDYFSDSFAGAFSLRFCHHLQKALLNITLFYFSHFSQLLHSIWNFSLPFQCLLFFIKSMYHSCYSTLVRFSKHWHKSTMSNRIWSFIRPSQRLISQIYFLLCIIERGWIETCEKMVKYFQQWNLNPLNQFTFFHL